MKDYISVIMLFSLLSCTRSYQSRNCIYNYTISIGENVNIDKSDVEKAISSVLEKNNESRNRIDILVFGYSMGKELFSYSGKGADDLKVKTNPGRMDVLVKIRQDNNLKDVMFLKAHGGSKQEIMNMLEGELRKALCN